MMVTITMEMDAMNNAKDKINSYVQTHDTKNQFVVWTLQSNHLYTVCQESLDQVL